MAEILRYSSHGNNVSVFSLKNIGIIRKIAYSNSAKYYILKEERGLSWYEDLLGKEKLLIKELVNLKNYSKLDLYFLDGFSLSYLAPLRKTHFYINQCIDHYHEKWPKRNFAPIHGDLTLSNIIFIKKDPIFIDWEHFSEDDFLWGFDIAYLLLSSLILPDRNKINFHPKDISIFSKLWKKLISLGLSKEIADNPLSYFREIFTTNKNWEKIVNDSPNKLFPLSKSKEYNFFFENKILQDIYKNF